MRYERLPQGQRDDGENSQDADPNAGFLEARAATNLSIDEWPREHGEDYESGGENRERARVAGKIVARVDNRIISTRPSVSSV